MVEEKLKYGDKYKEVIRQRKLEKKKKIDAVSNELKKLLAEIDLF